MAQSKSYFNALMQKGLGSFSDFCFFLMDDVLVHNSTEEDHLKKSQNDKRQG